MNLSVNILTTLAGRIIILFLALLSSIFLARILGPEGRGLFALVLLMPEWAKSFGLFGFDQANAVYGGLEAGKRKYLLWHSVAIAAAVGGLFVLIGGGFLLLGAPGTKLLSHGPMWLFLAPLTIIPCKFLIEFWLGLLRGMNKIVLLNIFEVVTKLTSVFFVIVLLAYLHLDVKGAVLSDILITIGSVFVLILLLKDVGIWKKPSFDKPLFLRTVKFALPSHGGTIAAYINYRVDELIIAAMLPLEQLGYYAIAVALVERLWILPGAVANALLPHLANSKVREPGLPSAIARHVMIWMGLGCLIVFVLAGVIINFLYSSAYAPAIAPLRWLLPGVFTLSIGKILVAELLAREKVLYTVWASTSAAIVNIVANLLLVPRLGITGAAIASSISYTMMSCILIWFFLGETKASWKLLLPCREDFHTYNSVMNSLKKP